MKPLALIIILFMGLFSTSIVQAKTHSKKRHHKTQDKKAQSAVDPIALKLIAQIDERPIRVPQNEVTSVEVVPTKSAWLAQIYILNLVEASNLTAILSDKLLQTRVFEHYLGQKSDRFLLHTIGLKEFLLKYHLTDPEGQLIPDTDNFEEALATEFPSGFVVRPALGVAPLERNHGLFASNDDFLKAIFRPDNQLYQARTLHQNIKSHIIGSVASGEAIILQDDFTKSYRAPQKLKMKVYERIRLHSFENKVVQDATPDLWSLRRNFDVNAEQTKNIEKFVQDFLDSLPEVCTTRQAWGIDVGLLDNGEMKILDIITNRGMKTAWSSYLDEPRILGAYTRHIQEHLNIEFRGFGGFLFKQNLANYLNYWQLKKERGSHIGTSQILSAMPPWPF